MRRSGSPVPKQRVLRLHATDRVILDNACHHMRGMPGVSSASVSDDKLVIEYDLRQVTFLQIESVAVAEGLQLKGGLHQFWRDMWKYTERNEWDNLARTGDGACCNRPPPKAR